MEAIRRIEQVHGNSLTMVLPDAFKEMRVEVIVLPLDEPVSIREPHRQPHPDIAGKGKILGDIISPACPPEDWEALCCTNRSSPNTSPETEMNSKVINIVSVTQIDKYKLRLGFDDGVVQEVDFGAFLGKAQHPEIRAYLEEKRFNAYRLEHGELVWGDYDLCFPIMDLYLNQIDKQGDLQAVA